MGDLPKTIRNPTCSLDYGTLDPQAYDHLNSKPASYQPTRNLKPLSRNPNSLLKEPFSRVLLSIIRIPYNPHIIPRSFDPGSFGARRTWSFEAPAVLLQDLQDAPHFLASSKEAGLALNRGPNQDSYRHLESTQRGAYPD